MGSRYNTDYDGYPVVDIDSDHENDSNSSDEVEIILNGTPEQKRKLTKRIVKGHPEGLSDGSSEDEFEKDMRKELDQTMKNIEKQNNLSKRQILSAVTNSGTPLQGSTSSQATTYAGSCASISDVKEKEFYDDIYFDSDSDEEICANRDGSGKKRPVLSNDDLLYDPESDDRDQRWIDRQKRKNRTKSVQSDAVLNCPACMTTVCMECQRHDIYKNQYRAIFVVNCSADQSQLLRYPSAGEGSKKRKKEEKKQRRKRRHEEEENDRMKDSHEKLAEMNGEAIDAEELYNPVRCTECGTEIGVCDKEEVYHFFNVLASHA